MSVPSIGVSRTILSSCPLHKETPLVTFGPGVSLISAYLVVVAVTVLAFLAYFLNHRGLGGTGCTNAFPTRIAGDPA